jgi:hypothetical protein
VKGKLMGGDSVRGSVRIVLCTHVNVCLCPVCARISVLVRACRFVPRAVYHAPCATSPPVSPLQVEGVGKRSPTYQVLTGIMVLLCTAFAVAWLGVVLYKMGTSARDAHRRRSLVKARGAGLTGDAAAATGHSVVRRSSTVVGSSSRPEYRRPPPPPPQVMHGDGVHTRPSDVASMPGALGLTLVTHAGSRADRVSAARVTGREAGAPLRLPVDPMPNAGVHPVSAVGHSASEACAGVCASNVGGSHKGHWPGLAPQGPSRGAALTGHSAGHSAGGESVLLEPEGARSESGPDSGSTVPQAGVTVNPLFVRVHPGVDACRARS